MFCRVNPFAFTVLLKPAPATLDARKLCQCTTLLYADLGIALQRSIEVFATRKSVEEKETVGS